MPKKTLRYIITDYDTQINLGKYRQGRTRKSALSASAGQNSRRVLIEYHEEILGRPHKSARIFAEKMSNARRPVAATPQRRAFARLRVVSTRDNFSSHMEGTRVWLSEWFHGRLPVGLPSPTRPGSFGLHSYSIVVLQNS